MSEEVLIPPVVEGETTKAQRARREAWLRDHSFQNVDAIVGAAEMPNRPSIQRCAAMIAKESYGRNLYQEGSILGGQEVTRANFQGTVSPWHYDTGGTTGIGMCQLTYWGFVLLANSKGGVWNAYCNCQAGFETLHELIEEHGVWGGFERWNGEGWAAEQYADDAVALERLFTAQGLH